MNQCMSLHPAAGLIAALGFAVGCGYAALVYTLNHHRRLGWYWRAHSWLLVVAGNILVATFVAWTLQSWLVFVAIIAVNMLLGAPQIVIAVFDAGTQAQDSNEAQHADRIARGS